MRIFLRKKSVKSLSVGGSAPEPPFVSGGWGPPDPHVVTHAIVTTFTYFPLQTL